MSSLSWRNSSVRECSFPVGGPCVEETVTACLIQESALQSPIESAECSADLFPNRPVGMDLYLANSKVVYDQHYSGENVKQNWCSDNPSVMFVYKISVSSLPKSVVILVFCITVCIPRENNLFMRPVFDMYNNMFK